MTHTLKDVWEAQGWQWRTLAQAAHISQSTLWRMNRKEEGIAWGTVLRVCRILGLTLDDYVRLDPGPDHGE